MTADPSEDGWQEYATALATLDTERRRAAREGDLARRTLADTGRFLEETAQVLTGQRQRLLALATELRAPLAPTDLAPAPVGPLDRDQGAADLTAQLARADDATTETRRIGALPQLLPGWHSNLARDLVVYAALCIPNAMMSVTLAFVSSFTLLLWFLVGFPTLVLVIGPPLVAVVCTPRLRTDHDAGWHKIYRRGHHRLAAVLGVVLAWLSWYVPAEMVYLLSVHELR